MKRIYLLVTVIMAVWGVHAQEAAGEAEPFRLLVISSSSGKTAQTYLPDLAKHEGINLRHIQAFIGGATFERHWTSIEKTQADPEFVSHSTNSDKVRRPNGWTCSLVELIDSEEWDVVVTQQGARMAGKPKAIGWQPYADQFIAYLREHAPEAEIILQQTYSFTATEAERYGGQEAQFAHIERNYRELAGNQKLEVIPMGLAVQLAREGATYRFATEEELTALEYPNLPPHIGDVIGGYEWKWKRGSKPPEYELKLDELHVNQRGAYLQACVWYGVIFDKDPLTISFVPEGLDAEDASFLRQCAAQAIATFEQATADK